MLKSLTLKNKERNTKIHDENQYLNLIDDILKYGELIDGRNGKTKMIYGSAMHFSLENNILPLLTSKKVAWKTCLKELLWFISGNTDNRVLQKQGVKIWNGNGCREFLDSRGLYNLEENDLGPVYGHQWRFFNAEYTNCNEDYTGKGVDQLQQVIDMLNDPVERYSRRIIMSAWNPNQLNEMALPPCHVLVQFNVSKDNKLSASLYQRSGDVGLGVPFNIASYSFLIHLLAHHCNLEAYEFIYYLGNTHIYDDHLEVLEEQIKRVPYDLPNIKVLNKYENINDYKIEDFEINNYKSHETIKMVMRK